MIKNTRIPEMEQAVQVIFDMSADTVLRERARMREKALHDEASAIKGAREEGLAEGMEKGRLAERAKIIENLRKSGMTEEQIKLVLGDD